MILKRNNVERVSDKPAEIEALKLEGFKPVAGEEPKKEPKKISDMSKAELVKLAETAGIDGAKSLNKEDLIEILEKR